MTLPRAVTRILAWLLVDHVRRAPDFIIGGHERPYLKRWWLVRNRWCAIYLHQFLRDDDDRALHDHPWANVSIVLRGGYIEVTPGYYSTDGVGRTRPAFDAVTRTTRFAGDVVRRSATDAHRIELFGTAECWTLFLCGPIVRDWGFWCPQGWRPWQEFVDSKDKGRSGRGCA